MTKKNLIPMLLMALSANAIANSACDKPRNDFDDLYCLNKVYQQADTDLNAAYKSLATKLDADGKSALKQGQLGWMRERNAQCSRSEDGHFLVDLECATTRTVQRVQFLQDRERECVSAGCQNSKL